MEQGRARLPPPRRRPPPAVRADDGNNQEPRRDFHCETVAAVKIT